MSLHPRISHSASVLCDIMHQKSPLYHSQLTFTQSQGLRIFEQIRNTCKRLKTSKQKNWMVRFFFFLLLGCTSAPPPPLPPPLHSVHFWIEFGQPGSSLAGQIIISLPARIQRHIQTLNFKPPLTMALSDNRHMPVPQPPRLSLRAQKRHGYPKKPSTISARQKKAKRCDKITFSSITFDLVALKIMKNLTGAKSQLWNVAITSMS